MSRGWSVSAELRGREMAGMRHKRDFTSPTGPSPRRHRCFNPLCNQFLEAPKGLVVNPKLFKVRDGIVEVFGHGSPMAHRCGKCISNFLCRHSADVGVALSIDREGDGTERSGGGLAPSPNAGEGRLPDQHLAAEKPAEVGLDRIRRQALDDTLACAAAVERQHEAGPLFCSAKTAVPTEAEGAMPTSHDGDPPLDDIAGRFPNQGAVSEDPYLATRRSASEQGARTAS